MQIITEHLLKWDTENQCSRGYGILGDIQAFARADEEQGRGSLHAHWNIFVKQLSQQIRNFLFHHDPSVRAKTREEFAMYIDSIICASYGTDLEVVHNCRSSSIPNMDGSVCNGSAIQSDEESRRRKDEKTKRDIPIPLKKSFEPEEIQLFRDARHKSLSKIIQGRVIKCKRRCKLTIASKDIINSHLAIQANKLGVSFVSPSTSQQYESYILKLLYVISHHLYSVSGDDLLVGICNFLSLTIR
jgi:hypothetical protein